MKVSVLLVSFNHEAYIEKCIEGILIQEFQDEWEIVVADDCSTDNTLSIISERLRNSEVAYIVIKGEVNLGLEKNYKRGFEACSGEYIAVIEGDDYWVSPSRLRKHTEFLEEHRECAMSFNRKIKYTQGSNSYSVDKWSESENYEYITAEQLAYSNRIGNMSTCVYRSVCIKGLDEGIYDLPLADWLLGMAVAQYGFVAKLKDATSVYRVHASGLWSAKTEQEKKDEVLGVIDRYNEYFGFRYNEEFNRHKRKLNGSYGILEWIPPFVKPLLKCLVPPGLVALIRRKK